MQQRLLVLFALALVLGQSFASNCTTEADPLRKWLCGITIPLPTSTEQIGIFNVVLSEGTCGSLDIGNIASSTADTNFTLTITGLGLECAYKKIYLKDLPKQAGSIIFSVDRSSLSGEVQLDLDQGHYVNGAVARDFVTDINITDLEVLGIKKLNSDKVKGLLSNALDNLTTTALTDLINTNLTNVLRNVTELLKEVESHVPLTPPQCKPLPGSADLRKSGVIKIVDFLLDDLISSTGPNNILNQLLSDLTNGSGNMTFSNPNASFTVPIPNIGNISIELLNLTLSGLTSFDELKILIPTQACALDTQTRMDDLKIELGLNLTFVPVDKNTTAPFPVLSEVFDVIVDVKDASLDLLVDINVDQQATNDLKPQDLFQVGCICSTVQEIGVSWLHLDFSLTETAISPRVAGIEEGLDSAINNLVELVINNFDRFIPVFLDAATAELVQNISGALNHTITSQTCPNIPRKSDLGYSITVAYAVLGGFAVISIALILFVRQKNKTTRSYELDASESAPLLLAGDGTDTALAPSLVEEPGLPMYAKYLTPILLFATIGLLVFSNNSAGANVTPSIEINGEFYEFEPLFTFDLTNTIRDMWKAKVYPLSLLVAVFSGSWPYLKLIIMLACFCVPVHLLSETRREWFLRVIDALGKWSLIDTYILVMMMVAFRFEIPLVPAGSGLDVTGLEIFVKPCNGFHTFLIATVMSLVLSHYLVYLHRKASDQHHHPVPDHEWQSLGRHHFVSQGRVYFFTWFGVAIVSILIIVTIAIIIVGATTIAFTFDFKGLAAGALEFEHDVMGYSESPVRHLSLISVGEGIPGVTRNPDAFSTRWIQAAFLSFSLAVPLVHMASMLFIWVVPLPALAQRRCFIAIEVFNAWSGLDVFVIALLATVLELQEFAKFIIGDTCDGLNKILESLVAAGKLPSDIEPKCFDLIATLGEGCWYLFAAALITDITALLVMQLCHMALHERLHPRTGKPAVIQTGLDRKDYDEEEPPAGCCANAMIWLATTTGLLRYAGTTV